MIAAGGGTDACVQTEIVIKNKEEIMLKKREDSVGKHERPEEKT